MSNHRYDDNVIDLQARRRCHLERSGLGQRRRLRRRGLGGMSKSGSAATPQVNPIVQAASDQVTSRKRLPRKDIHAPCSGQLALFDPKQGDQS
jgi:hypothetical protein